MESESLMSTNAEYWRNHRRVRRAFGSASEYLCYVCNGPAESWAFHWRDYPDPSNPESYFPMCNNDHREYDLTPELRSAKSKQMKKLWENPEFRATKSDRMKQNWQNPKFRAAQAESMHRRWEDPEQQKEISDRNKRNWQDPEFRERISAAVSESNRRRVRGK
jgi:hypothetical protein